MSSIGTVNEGLLKAVFDSDLEQVKLHLAAGADANYKLGDSGCTLLHHAPTAKIASELLLFGADVHSKDIFGRTPLCNAAAKWNGLEIVKVLLSAGASVNVRMAIGNTPLHVAPTNEITKELLTQQAEVNVVDNFGRAPLHSALIDRKGLEVFKTLLAAGADINMRTGILENSLLHYADSLDITREILSHGVSINIRKIDGQTPLHCAVKHMKEAAIVRELLQHGAEVDLLDNEGDTPLAIAMRNHTKDFEVIKDLLEFGSDVNMEIFDYSLVRYCTIINSVAFHDLSCAKLLARICIFKYFEDDIACIELEDGIHPSNIKTLINYKEECILEVLQMRVERINNGKVTLYKLVTKEGAYARPLYASYRAIEKEVLGKYSIYQEIILDKLKRCLERGLLITRLNGIDVCTPSSININREVKLNTDCVLIIAEYLTDSDLSNFIAAFE